jgi:hypothetical protein
MTDIKFFTESKVALGVSADEAQGNMGEIEATVTTWGAREGADGRKFNYNLKDLLNGQMNLLTLANHFQCFFNIMMNQCL